MSASHWNILKFVNMRQIKFRAWNKENKIMHQPCSMVSNWDSKTMSYETETPYCIYMQYTGLKDQNGQEIYEGDIMKVLDRDWFDKEKDTKTFIVYYANDSFILTTLVGIDERKKENPNTYNKDWIEAKLSRSYGRDRFEIIGNIYQNSELLK